MDAPLLRAIGLSKNEKAVLDALLRMKMARPVSFIARNAGVPRTTALCILRRFESRKLARKVWSGVKYKWMYDKTADYVDRNFKKFKN